MADKNNRPKGTDIIISLHLFNKDLPYDNQINILATKYPNKLLPGAFWLSLDLYPKLQDEESDLGEIMISSIFPTGKVHSNKECYMHKLLEVLLRKIPYQYSGRSYFIFLRRARYACHRSTMAIREILIFVLNFSIPFRILLLLIAKISKIRLFAVGSSS